MQIGVSVFLYFDRKFGFSLRRIDVSGFALELWFGWLCITAGWLTKRAGDLAYTSANSQVSGDNTPSA